MCTGMGPHYLLLLSCLDCGLCDRIESLDIQYNLEAPEVISAAPSFQMSPHCLPHLSTGKSHGWLQKQQGLSLIPTLHKRHEFPTLVPGSPTLVRGPTVYPIAQS